MAARVAAASITAVLCTVAHSTAVAPNDPSLFYSPYGWNTSSTAATTANTGSYMRCLFTGGAVNLTSDVSSMVSPPSQVYWRVDNGPLTPAEVSPLLQLTIPASTLGNSDIPYHALEVVVKSMTETMNRWAAAGLSTRISFTGLQLEAGAGVASVLPAANSILVFGDSITEGVRTLGERQPHDTDRNDATLCWSTRLGALLGVETGVIGFGATGLDEGGSGGVPAIGASWDLQWEGVPRVFSPPPSLVVLNEGTNDGTKDTVAAATLLFNALVARFPAVPIVVLRPFNGAQAANLQAAIAASTRPASFHYVDTAGFFDTSFGTDTMNLHPSGPNGVARIAPRVAAALRPLLAAGVAAEYK